MGQQRDPREDDWKMEDEFEESDDEFIKDELEEEKEYRKYKNKVLALRDMMKLPEVKAYKGSLSKSDTLAFQRNRASLLAFSDVCGFYHDPLNLSSFSKIFLHKFQL